MSENKESSQTSSNSEFPLPTPPGDAEPGATGKSYFVLGQKYAYATISLVLGLVCFFNLAGLEKAILAIIFGCLALKASPAPVLKQRRAWAKAGIVLAAIILVFIPILIVILVGLDGFREVVAAFEKLSNGK